MTLPMTVKEVGAYLQVGDATIYKWLKRGKIPSKKLYGQWAFRKSDIDAWIDAHMIERKP